MSVALVSPPAADAETHSVESSMLAELLHLAECFGAIDFGPSEIGHSNAIPSYVSVSIRASGDLVFTAIQDLDANNIYTNDNYWHEKFDEEGRPVEDIAQLIPDVATAELWARRRCIAMAQAVYDGAKKGHLTSDGPHVL